MTMPELRRHGLLYLSVRRAGNGNGGTARP